MILEKFYTDKYDNDILFINPDMTFGEFKRHIYFQINEFKKMPQENVVLFGENYFEFGVNFFASIFAKKNIYLITDKLRLKQLDVDYILPQKTSPIDGNIEEKIEAKSVVMNFFTSGSTGEPKSIKKTLHNLEVETQCVIDTFNLKPDLLVASTTPSTHSFGLAFNFLLPILGNFKMIRHKIDFPEQIDYEEKYILISSPSFMEKLAKYDFEFEKAPQYIFLAGAKLKPDIMDYFKKYSDVVDIYGSTETGDIAYKRGYDEFTLFDGVAISKDEEDRIVVMSDFFPDNKIILSDIIEFTTDTTFVIKKRSDRFVKIVEKRVSLDEIENYLRQHEKVRDCYCMLCDDKFCCAVVTDDISLDGKALKNYLLKYSEIVPKRWRFLDEIPKTTSGKIDKTKLRQIFGMNLSLPFVVSRKTNQQEVFINLVFKNSCNFFRGHFDVMPILPGVVQLYYAKFFADEVFHTELSTEKVKKVKFSNIIKPDQEVTLKISNSENSMEFSYLGNDKVYSSGIFIK